MMSLNGDLQRKTASRSVSPVITNNNNPRQSSQHNQSTQRVKTYYSSLKDVVRQKPRVLGGKRASPPRDSSFAKYQLKSSSNQHNQLSRQKQQQFNYSSYHEHENAPYHTQRSISMRYDPQDNNTTNNTSISVNPPANHMICVNELHGISTDRPMQSRDFEPSHLGYNKSSSKPIKASKFRNDKN